MKKKPVKSRCEKKVEKQRVRLVRPGSPLGARGSTNQQDKLTKEDKLTEKNPLREDKLIKGEVLEDKPRKTLTRPGRLRARSGHIGPNGPPGFPVFVSNLAAPGFRTAVPAPFWVPGGQFFVILAEFGSIYLPLLFDFHLKTLKNTFWGKKRGFFEPRS